jgi:protein-S-isoprenylcysteine O-methyltransferase Ste14
MIRLHPFLAALLVLAFAFFVFWRARIDYRASGKLTLVSAVLQLMAFLVHGLASYSFLDNGGVSAPAGGSLQALAYGVMVVGMAGTLAGMGQLSLGDTVGKSVRGLKTKGMYRLSRNPQLIFYFLFLAGYVLLQPGWEGLVWLALYVVMAHVMVLTEEDHLRRAFGEEFKEYCRKTPRYFAVPMPG